MALFNCSGLSLDDDWMDQSITKARLYVINCSFHGCEKDNFQMKNYDAFLIFAQNIDREYTLEPPQ